MRVISVVFFGLAAAIIAGTGYGFGLPELGVVGVFLAALSLVGLAGIRSELYHVLLVLFAAAACAMGLFRLPPLLCAAAMAAAIIGWDTGRIRPLLQGASVHDRRHFAFSYVARVVPVGVFALVLVFAAGRIRIPLSFGAGLALSFAALVLAALFLRALPRREKHPAEPVEDESVTSSQSVSGGDSPRRPSR